MKILMTVIMTMAMTSAFAGECKLNGECKADADCKSLNRDFSVIGGKCINPAASQVETECAGIVSSAGAKGATSDSSSAVGGKATEGTGK